MPMGKTWGAVVVGLSVGLLPGTVRADEEEEVPPVPRTLFLLQPVSSMGVGVERALGSHVALAASLKVDLALYGAFETSSYSSRTGSVGLEPGVHVYLAGRAPEGFWVGAHLEAALSRTSFLGIGLGPGGSQPVLSGGGTYSLGGSARLGYTAILSPGLTLQAGLGIGRVDTHSLKGEEGGYLGGGLLRPPTWYVGPRVSLGVGWAI